MTLSNTIKIEYRTLYFFFKKTVCLGLLLRVSFKNVCCCRFDMLESKDITLTNEQRRNLAHIAKLLQYSSSKLGNIISHY